MRKYYLTLVFIGFLICLILALMFCKPTSAVPAKLVLHAPLYGTSWADGTLCVFGDVTNVGGGVAYNARLFVIVNGGEREYEAFLGKFLLNEYRPLGDFSPGECKHFECDLVDYCSSDETRCTFRLTWNYERMFACVSMDSLIPSGGD